MPSGTFTHTVAVAAAAPAIWEALQDAETWARIGPIEEVWDAEHTHDGALDRYRWSADAAGRRWVGSATTTRADAPEVMSMRLETNEMRGTITVAVSPAAGDSSIVTVTLDAEATGMLATLFWGVVSKAIGAGLPKQVEGFGARLAGRSN